MRQLLFVICLALIVLPVLADNNIVTIPIDGQLKICQVDYGQNVSMTGYSINSSVTQPSTQSWEFLGSLNGNDYTLLDIQNGIGLTANIGNDYTLSGINPYRYYALVMTGGFYQSGVFTVNFTSVITTGGTPGTDFYSSSPITTLGSSTGFVDSSTNSPVSWYWLFGDGGQSTVQNPYHTYESMAIIL